MLITTTFTPPTSDLEMLDTFSPFSVSDCSVLCIGKQYFFYFHFIFLFSLINIFIFKRYKKNNIYIF